MTFAQPFSEYEVLDRVGAGSMGTVFKARHKKLDRIVALKVLRPSLGRDTRYVDRLRREARIVASLNHPNIVTGYDLGQEGGYHFFVMEFVEGKSLRELLSEWGIFDEERVLDVAIQITTALDHAFQCGVIHRDIKPANILIANSNVVKLTDMGLAKGPDNLTITRDGATVGTPQYISPEQARNPQDVDVRTDLYSLGATLFHMCTGQPPFRAETMANVLCKVLEERAPSAAGINPNLSDGLNLIIRKLLSKDPDRRYQTPGALLADLHRVQRAEPPDVQVDDLDRGEDRSATPGWKWALWGLAAAGVVAVPVSLGLVDWGDDVVGVPLSERKRAYHRLVEDKLATFSRVGVEYRCLQTMRETAAEKFEEDYLDQKMAGVVQKLSGAVELLFGQEADVLDQTFATLSWNRTLSDLEDRVEDRIREEVGIPVLGLPPAARAAYDKEWSRLEIGARSRVLARETSFSRAVADYSQRLQARIRNHLQEPDYVSAAADLAAGLLGYERVSDTVPLSRDLPENLREIASKARSVQAEQLGAAISTLELARRKTFESGLRDVSTRVDKLLTEPDPETARSVYQEALASLKRDFPRRFRAQYDPWPNAEIRLARLDAKIEAAEASQLGEAVRQLLGATYRIVLSGDLRKARSELVVGAAGRAAPSLPRHIQLLDAAIAVRGELLASLLGTRKVYKLKGVRTLEGALDVELRRRAGQLVLQPAGGQESIALGLLRVSDLVPPGFIAGLSDEHKVGLAVWFLLTGAEEFAFLVEGSPWSQFVRDELAPLLRNLKRPEPGWLADRRLFESVRKAVKAREWAVARKSMTSLRARPGSFAADNDQELRSLGRAIEEGLAQADLQRSLQARVMGGGQLQVDARLAVALVYPDLSKVTFPEGLPPGWARDAGDAGVAFELDGVALGDARALSFASLCATGKPMSVRFEFSFSSDRGATRLFFLTMHEASLGLAALRDGRVVVFDVSKLREGKELRSRVQRALRFAEEHSGAWLVPGARHRLDIDVRPRGFGGKVVLTPRLDGRALPEVSIVRATGRVPAVVRLTALHSLQAYSLSVHGSGQ